MRKRDRLKHVREGMEACKTTVMNIKRRFKDELKPEEERLLREVLRDEGLLAGEWRYRRRMLGLLIIEYRHSVYHTAAQELLAVIDAPEPFCSWQLLDEDGGAELTVGDQVIHITVKSECLETLMDTYHITIDFEAAKLELIRAVEEVEALSAWLKDSGVEGFEVEVKIRESP